MKNEIKNNLLVFYFFSSLLKKWESSLTEKKSKIMKLKYIYILSKIKQISIKIIRTKIDL
jgi:hypothetical protein